MIGCESLSSCPVAAREDAAYRSPPLCCAPMGTSELTAGAILLRMRKMGGAKPRRALRECLEQMAKFNRSVVSSRSAALSYAGGFDVSSACGGRCHRLLFRVALSPSRSFGRLDPSWHGGWIYGDSHYLWSLFLRKGAECPMKSTVPSGWWLAADPSALGTDH